MGDWQLARFKSNPANKGKVMDQGLWAFSRHPNYFGEFLIWWGLFLVTLATPDNWWTVCSPLIVTMVLLKMTGIPLTEKAITSTRPGYEAYVKRTNAFIPWFPKEGGRVNMLIDMADKGILPDRLIRLGIRYLDKKRLTQEDRGAPQKQREALEGLIAHMNESPIAMNTQEANAQHYEVPASFFKVSARQTPEIQWLLTGRMVSRSSTPPRRPCWL